MLYVFPKANNSKPYQASPTNVAVRGHYYSSRDDFGDYDPAIEHDLGAIESVAKPILDKIIRTENITLEEKNHLATYIGLMHTRTPNFREGVENSMREMAELLKNHIYANNKEIGPLIDDAPQAIIDAAGGKDNIREWACKNLTVKVLPEASLSHIGVGLIIANFLSKMHWRFIVNKSNSCNFITSDNPCYVTNKSMNNSAYGVGIALAGSKLNFPISPAVFLIADWTGIGTEYKAVKDKLRVTRINSRTIRHAEREIYACCCNQGLEALIKKNRGYNFSSTVDHVGPYHIQRRKLMKSSTNS